MIELEKQQNSNTEREVMETPRTDKIVWRAAHDDDFERGMVASELKSAHNGICILLDATKMLDAIKAGVEKDG